MDNAFRLNEEIINRLVETRGIAASNYASAINSITDYCEDYILTNKKNNKNNNGWSFDVPLAKTKNIQIFKELHIHVNIIDIGNEPLTIGKGSGDNTAYPRIFGDVVDGKYVYPLNITINSYSKGVYLYRQTFLGVLYHELNHLVEQLKRARTSNGGNKNVYSQAIMHRNGHIDIELTTNPSTDKLIKDVIYRLFSASEFNALTSEVFGELKAVNSIRKNWSTDIQRTKAFALYAYFKSNYQVFENLSDDTYQRLKTFFDHTPLQGYHQSASLQQFKKWFLFSLKKRINALYKNIGIAVSYWYDVKEDEEAIKNRMEHKPIKVINQSLDESVLRFLSTYKRIIDY